MRVGALFEVIKTKASGALALRAAIVGANFGVMVGLAAVLGIADFGELMFYWSIALLCGTLLSVGGPMILLRGLTDGHGVSRLQMLKYMFGWPLGIACLALPVLWTAWPAIAWIPILSAAFAINFSACVASILRARGSVMVSMALRDAGPFLALGCGSVLVAGSAAQSGLQSAAMILGFFTLVALAWGWRIADAPAFRVSRTGTRGHLSLWGASVIGVAIAQMDLIIGGAVLSPEALGLYALFRRMANVVALPVSVATWISGPRVSAAFGAGNWPALQVASSEGSRIAWYPAVLLFGVGVAGAALAAVTPFDDLPLSMVWVFVLLLLGALLQAYWASGYTVATLTDAPVLSLAARMIVLVTYVSFAVGQGPALTPLGNAMAYVVAMSGGSFWLWAMLRRRFGVDTSAGALWPSGGRSWRMP